MRSRLSCVIAAIVLAAGKSRRMGTQKLLLPVDGKALIVHVAGEILRAGASPVIVVTSQDSDAVAKALAGLPVTRVINPSPDGDMLSSVRRGLEAVPPDCEWFLVATGDQPGISATLVRQLMEARRDSGKSLIVPVCRGRRGHPVLIRGIHREEILFCHDDVGLRGLFRHHPEAIVEVVVDDPRSLEDIDFPEDYARLTGNPPQIPESPAAPEA